jgi:hypothetical protein
MAKHRFVYVDDGVPEIGTRFLKQSCEQRDCEFIPVHPASYDFSSPEQLRPGDLLYRPAISLASQRVEQQLYAPGVATFYRDERSVYFSCGNPVLLFQRHGLSIPRTIFCQTSDRKVLTHYATRLGGLPLVFKIPGFSTGIGVGRVDTLAGLYSFVDLALALGRTPLLQAYVDDAVHWRLIVVGDEVVASYRNVIREDDFRTSASRESEDYSATPSDGLKQLGVTATRVLGYELGGVDVLEHSSGRGYLLEANFPCYFAQAQDVAGVDISGAMLDHLLAKADRLAPG